jgi:hypothetical protein
VSAHEGGGIALDDAVFVNVVNNTIAKNLTTATALTSNGSAAPAGLSSGALSDPLMARLQNASLFPRSDILASTTFAKPTMFNDVFWDNRAGNFLGGYVYGIGGNLPDGSPNNIDNWDMGVVDVPGALLEPTNSVVQVNDGTTADPSNTSADPLFVAPYDVTVNILAARTYPAFRQAVIVAELLPPSLMGDYHIQASLLGPDSSAYGLGVASKTVTWGTATNPFRYTIAAPSLDIDGNPRPTVLGTNVVPIYRYDSGADQVADDIVPVPVVLPAFRTPTLRHTALTVNRTPRVRAVPRTNAVKRGKAVTRPKPINLRSAK